MNNIGLWARKRWLCFMMMVILDIKCRIIYIGWYYYRILLEDKGEGPPPKAEPIAAAQLLQNVIVDDVIYYDGDNMG